MSYLHVLIHVPCSGLPVVSHSSCKCNIWKQKYHSIPESPPLLFISTFFILPSHYKIFPHHKMHHSNDNPHVAWIITPCRQCSYLSTVLKITGWQRKQQQRATRLHRMEWISDVISWSHCRAWSWSYRIRMFSVLFSRVLRICVGEVHRPLSTLLQHLTAPTVKDTDTLETVPLTSAECRGKIIPDCWLPSCLENSV